LCAEKTPVLGALTAQSELTTAMRGTMRGAVRGGASEPPSLRASETPGDRGQPSRPAPGTSPLWAGPVPRRYSTRNRIVAGISRNAASRPSEKSLGVSVIT